MEILTALLADSATIKADGSWMLQEAAFTSLSVDSFPTPLFGMLVVQLGFEPYELGFEHELGVTITDAAGELVPPPFRYLLRPALGQPSQLLSVVHDFRTGLIDSIRPTHLSQPGNYAIRLYCDGAAKHTVSLVVGHRQDERVR